MVHALAADDVLRVAERPEHRDAAVADVVARTVVEEPDDLEPELAVLEDLIGDDAAEIPRARDEHPFQPDAGAPAALERFADQLARGIRERDVEGQEDQPDPLRDFVK